MRDHRVTWGMAAAVAVIVMSVAWLSGELSQAWIIRAGGLVGIGILVSIGWHQRERRLDEEIAMELLMAKAIRLYRETDPSR